MAKKNKVEMAFRSDGNIGYYSKDGTIFFPKEMVDFEMAMVFGVMRMRCDEKNTAKKKEMEENILFHLKVLDSLSNAYNSIK